ncbi:cytochrome P450 [Apiosordaria backusii]|uniref:Cytochrome P450 n=1 Tax=Apiosordaria backusii TaxID=314023 RepID=A0AA40DF65_9PEZI|nr:cytochrome P450 [Apiosordaria backusii]
MTTREHDVDWLLVSFPVTAGIAAVILAIMINALATPRKADPREPPLLKPTIPFVGHAIGFIRHQARYHYTLQRTSQQPIVTLPMLTGKLYAIWEPTLISAGLKNRHLSTKPQMEAVISPLFKVSKPTAKLMKGGLSDYLTDRIMFHALPASFAKETQQKFIDAALSEISKYFVALSSGASRQQEIVPNVWLFIRDVVAKATTPPLYGKDHDPFTHDPTLEQSFWDFNESLLALSIDILSNIFARAGNIGREKMAKAIAPYYHAHLEDHPSASALIRNRAKELRNAGVPVDDIARFEALLPFAAMINTVPTLFWFFAHVFTRPDLVQQLRKEIETGILSRTGSKAKLVISAAVLQEKTPLLWSCYKETLRLTIHQAVTRTVMQDTTITSAATGQTYFLQKGSVVQMSIGVAHNLPEFWGKDSEEFKADRFVGLTKSEGKALKAAHQPYGGGLHLCPGRHFALAEMMAVMTTLIVGFEVESLDGRAWRGPERGTASIVDAATKPKNEGKGFGAQIRSREGWEDVTWEYCF